MVYSTNTQKSNTMIHIDTANPENIEFINGSKSNIRVLLADGGIRIPPHSSSKILMSLYSASIPISFYNVRSDNNTFILKEGIFEMTITIPEGNYTAKTLATTVEALLNSASYYANTYTMTYSSVKNKFLYTTNDTVNTCYLVFSNTETPYILLGFNSGSQNTILTVGTYSTNSISVYDKFSLYIRSQLVNGQSTYLNNTRANILERINIKQFNTIASYEASPLQQRFDCGSFVNEITLSLTFEDESKLVDLQGLNWQISLLFTVSTGLQELPENRVFSDFIQNIPMISGGSGGVEETQ
jgi:hypothetical protein